MKFPLKILWLLALLFLVSCAPDPYQNAISGYGDMQHCLIPSPKLIVIDRDKTGNFVSKDEQKPEDMLHRYTLCKKENQIKYWKGFFLLRES